ncbi:hypothetical protein CMV_021438 [Castanea mollissima]|uniref:NB-ARC domain-containing protein n=1 Tax=Castanea mollissima TaxID=60419 RepID=A0A8J4QX83_9ROSI|nr:hypothetical protein CMV_021438 [Castanea mollissima]
MKDVKQLIDICSDIGDLNNFYLIYTNKLKELDEAIVRFCKVHMNAQNRGDILQILDQWKPTQQEKKSPIMKIGRLLCSVPRHPDFAVGLDVPLKVLKTQLLKEKKQQLLPTAPGGCGKTASVTMLGHDKEIIGKFKDKFFFVPVSKILNLMVIVQRLFHHICGQEPEFQSDEDAIYQLQELLTKIGSSPILLISDDVWSGSEFHLEKFKFDMPKYNILVTSRTIFPEFSFTYNLKSLNDEDATTLLHHSASLQDGNSRIPVEIIEKIVRSYGRFPLALEVSGKSLKEKPVEVWRSRASLMVILFSYEHGNDAVDNLHELTSWNRATLVRTRKESKDASENNNYYTCYNEDFVTQHDPLRELAIHESSRGPIRQRK